MVFQRILVICIGNICRSPMAAALLQQAMPGCDGNHKPHIESAGLHALVGKPADPMARTLMQERGLDISNHVARQLTPEMAKGFDLILAMEQAQVAEAISIAPELRGRVHTLGKWSGLEIADPYRQPRHAFEAALANIEQGVHDWISKLAK